MHFKYSTSNILLLYSEYTSEFEFFFLPFFMLLNQTCIQGKFPGTSTIKTKKENHSIFLSLYSVLSLFTLFKFYFAYFFLKKIPTLILVNAFTTIYLYFYVVIK